MSPASCLIQIICYRGVVRVGIQLPKRLERERNPHDAGQNWDTARQHGLQRRSLKVALDRILEYR
jgi:hypothetical protein